MSELKPDLSSELANESMGLSANVEQQHRDLRIRLLKGPLYREAHRQQWDLLERDQALLRHFFSQIGLALRLDESEGYAFLQQQEVDDDDSMPTLIARRSLTFAQSLLLVLLRKRLAEHDSEDSAPRLIVLRDEIHNWLTPYFADVANEVKQAKDFDALIKKVIEWGFLKTLANHQDEFEVKRILKAFVTAEQLVTFNQLLAERLPQDASTELSEQE